MFNPATFCLRRLGRTLSRLGLIDEYRGKRIAELAWPRFLTMFARSSFRVTDVSMVGLNIGSSAIAGLAFAAIYWQVAVSFGLGIAGERRLQLRHSDPIRLARAVGESLS